MVVAEPCGMQSLYVRERCESYEELAFSCREIGNRLYAVPLTS